MLELNTFLFVAIPTLPTQDLEKAKFTFETLGLNQRDYLIKARQEAFGTYLDSLELYVRRKNEGADEGELAHRKDELNSRHHPTVWHEMRRWHEYYPALRNLFQQAPELL